jgi:hypothetical protein
VGGGCACGLGGRGEPVLMTSLALLAISRRKRKKKQRTSLVN